MKDIFNQIYKKGYSNNSIAHHLFMSIDNVIQMKKNRPIFNNKKLKDLRKGKINRDAKN